jgi:hypothetical protein
LAEPTKILSHVHKAGTIASLSCAVHCMAMPLLIAVLPVVGISFLADGRFDRWMLLIGVLLPLPDLCWGFRKHKSIKAVSLLLAGFLWWWMAHQQRYQWRHLFCVAMCGVSFLWSNLLNRHLCKTCSTCNHTEPESLAVHLEATHEPVQ